MRVEQRRLENETKECEKVDRHETAKVVREKEKAILAAE